jgi:hypothetical protein
MSDTEDRQYRITWRSILGLGITSGYTITPAISSVSGEHLAEKTVTAAYYQREDGRYVFKRADGLLAFDIAIALVETIEIVEPAKAAA